MHKVKSERRDHKVYYVPHKVYCYFLTVFPVAYCRQVGFQPIFLLLHFSSSFVRISYWCSVLCTCCFVFSSHQYSTYNQCCTRIWQFHVRFSSFQKLYLKSVHPYPNIHFFSPTKLGLKLKLDLHKLKIYLFSVP